MWGQERPTKSDQEYNIVKKQGGWGYMKITLWEEGDKHVKGWDKPHF